MDTLEKDRVQILDYAVSISQSVDTLGKSVNPTILLPDMDR